MSELVDFFEAYDEVLTPLFTASSVLQLVTRAVETHLIDAIREPATAAAIAGSSDLAPSTVAVLLNALVVTGVVEQADGTYTLTPPWRALTDPGAFVPLDVALGGNAVNDRLLRDGGDYFRLSPADRVVFARSVSPDPYSDDLVAAFAAGIAKDPDRAAMADGGRLLELGCGVAGRVLTTLRAMPKLSAVGVELTEDLAAEARRRATDLGVTDRFEVVCTDASAYRADEPFDFGFWSQFFFPEESRAGALATLMACVRPGGTVQAPLGADFEKVRGDPAGAMARDYAVWRVVLDAWGVPERDPDELVAEFEAAGFADVAVTANEGAGPRVRATRPEC